MKTNTILYRTFNSMTVIKLTAFLFAAMLFASCTKQADFNNPFDPNVSIDSPTNLKIVTMQETSLSFEWNNNFNVNNTEQSNLIKIVIEQSSDGKIFSGRDTLAGLVSKATIAEEFEVSRSYYFRIYAVVGSKRTGYSNVVVGTESANYAPTDFVSQISGETLRRLSWKDNSVSESGFKILRKTGEAGIYDTLAILPPNSTVYEDTTVIMTDTNYYYKICAFFKNGMSSKYDSLTVNIAFPAPSDLHQTCLSSASVELEWKDNSDFETGYDILVSVNSQPFTELKKLSANSTSYIVNNLSSGNTYAFRVQAFTNYNISKYSNSIRISYVFANIQFLYSRQLKDNWQGVSSISFSPDGKIMACGGELDVDIIRAGDGEYITSLEHQYNEQVYSIKFSPDGKIIADGHGGKIWLWDAASYSSITQLYAYGTNQIRGIAFTPDGSKIIASTDMDKIQVWSVSGRNLINTFDGGNGNWGACDISPDGQYIASGDSLTLFKLSDGSVVRHYPTTIFLKSIVFHPSGKFIACIGANNYTLQFWNVADGTLVRQMQESFYANQIAFDIKGDRVAVSGRQDNIVNIRDVQSGEILNTLNVVGSTSVAFSPLNNLIAIGDSQAYVRVWAFSGTWKTAM